MGQELAGRGLETGDGLWSARALVNAPDDVVAVHRDFIDAGADVVTTNTYATTRRRLDPVDEGAFERLNRRAGELANRAREESGREVRIAGSLPPLHGSYRPDRVRPIEELEPLYREQAELLTEFVDVFLCETMSTAAEALAAARGAASTGRPVWVSWTVADDGSGRLRSGETVADAIRALKGVEVDALLLNCAMPESIDAAMPELAASTNVRFGAYANGFSAIGEEFDVADGANVPDRRAELTPDAYARFASGWLERGARVIGGCCEVGPSHIASLRTLVDGNHDAAG
jgi:S-methylmethionine-dependent homocysteine/selenocysteine methylase